MIAFLSHHPAVEQAARVAREFKLDPVELLSDGGDEWPMMVRIAAAQVVARDKRAEAEAAKKAAKGKK
jgi:hypothetical protein